MVCVVTLLFLYFENWLTKPTSEKGNNNNNNNHNINNIKSYTRWCVDFVGENWKQFIIPAMMVALLAAGKRWAVNNSVMYLLLSFLLPVWVLGHTARRMFPKVFGLQYYFFVFLSAILLVAFMGQSALNPGSNALFSLKYDAFPVKEDANWTYVYDGSRDQQPPYPVCLLRWGHAKHRVSTIDLAILSLYAYGSDSMYESGGDVNVSTQKTFNNQEVSACIVKHQKYSTVGRIIATRIAECSNENMCNDRSVAGTTVMAIKGSSQPYDFYVDFSMWAMISVFQGTTAFVPLLEQIPNWFFALILYLYPRSHEDQIFHNIEQEYKRLSERFPNDEFVLTGHSLGGGIAIAAGGRINVSAIGFSGPGSHFSRWRFGTTMERAYRNSVNVEPDYDTVPRFDRHDDMVQYIQCRDSKKNIKAGENYPHRHPAQCHSIDTTICELWRACGDEKKRNFHQRCSGLVDPAKRGRYLTGSFERKFWASLERIV